VFTLPTQGASGTFANGTNTLQVITDEQGRAVARGLHPNNVEGNVQIRVNASSQGRTGSAIINQNNVRGAAAAAAGGVSAKLIAILAIAGGAAAGIAVAATRGNGGTTTTATPPVTISPTVITTGAGSVSAPRP
jgi:hypothetical protein